MLKGILHKKLRMFTSEESVETVDRKVNLAIWQTFRHGLLITDEFKYITPDELKTY